MTPIAVVLALLIGTSMGLVGGGGAILTVPALVHVGGQYTRMYDPKSVETVKGEVVSVDFVTPMKGMARGVLLVLKTEMESIPMHLGPSWSSRTRTSSSSRRTLSKSKEPASALRENQPSSPRR